MGGEIKRDPKTGRMLPGTAAGPGNPWLREQHRLRQELYAGLSKGDIPAIIRRLVQDAKGGNTKAATLLLNYMLGKPTQHITADVTGTSLTPEAMRARLDELLGVVVEVEPPKVIEKTA